MIRRANNTEYGLASGVFTKDVSRALQFAERIDAGTVFVNTYNKTDVAAPFGGFKQSGFGKDLGMYTYNKAKDNQISKKGWLSILKIDNRTRTYSF